MTSFNYAATAATATSLLLSFGAPCTLKREVAGAYDPATGNAAVTETTFTTQAAVFAYDQKYINNTLILLGDQLAYMPPATAPKQGDLMTWQGKDYTVVAVKPVSPAGVPVLYEAQIRG
jgi:hypothetical protein